jgi:mRNA-degrading endonuclease RelE of RelBE toxin-antitoxin system
MWTYEVDKNLIKVLKKLSKKSKVVYDRVQKEIIKIASNPHLGKPLKFPLAGLRIHIGPFVLIMKLMKEEGKLNFFEFTHHDEAYK